MSKYEMARYEESEYEMDIFKTKALDNWPLVWRRFIDDIFMTWTHGETKLTKFIEY